MNQTANNTQQFSTLVQNQTQSPFQESEYSNYIDSSDIVVEYYKKTKVSGLEKYFLDIEDWLSKEVKEQEDNKPLVIQADEGVGKKTLLVKWMEYHQTLESGPEGKDIIIPHFATTGGNNTNYFFAIYRILIKLREILDINQKVELLEEKLRSYFAYWLSTCNENLEKQVINDKKYTYNRVILLIEGIDHFVDQGTTNKESSVAFWLPRFFPSRIKVIVTASKNSNAYEYFQSKKSPILSIPVDSGIVQTMIDEKRNSTSLLLDAETVQKHLQILEEIPAELKNNLLVKSFLSILLPESDNSYVNDLLVKKEKLTQIYNQIDFTGFSQVKDSIQFFDKIFDQLEKSDLMDPLRFQKLLEILCISQKGLSFEEIREITSVETDEWSLFITIFKEFFIVYQQYWIINNDSLSRAISKRYLSISKQVRSQDESVQKPSTNQDEPAATTGKRNSLRAKQVSNESYREEFEPNQQHLRELHNEIASVIDRITPNSIRKLEEQTFHLYKAQEYFNLKEKISAIENFLLMFNPNNKYDLCRYWQTLESKGFDPVIEYNKAIEGFEMHYHPTPEDVFRIIVQISRFLKEFSDFETYFTPAFRHPPITGSFDELYNIGLLNELWNLSIYASRDMSKEDILEKLEQLNKESKDKSQAVKLREMIEELKNRRKEQAEENKTLIRDGKSETLRRKKEKAHQRVPQKKLDILLPQESINVDVPANRQKFREWYIEMIENILNHEKNQLEKNSQSSHHEDQVDAVLMQKIQRFKDHQREIEQETLANQSSLVSKDSTNDLEAKLKNLGLDKAKGAHDDVESKLRALREHYDLSDRNPTNYYYKRWIWVQFPWACLSLKCDYSMKMMKCFSSATEYMSVDDEQKFTKQALKIAIESKLKKQRMYQKQEEQQSGLINANLSRISGNTVSLPRIAGNKRAGSTQMQKSQSITKLTLEGIDDSSIARADRILGKNYSMTGTHAGAIAQRGLADDNMTGNNSVGFFLTEDEHINLTMLNKDDSHNPQLSQKRGNSSIIDNSNLQKTSKLLERRQIFKEKTRLFDPINTIQENQKLQQVLPRLKGSIIDHSNKELYLLEQQSYDFKKEFDRLIAENKSLGNKLKELRIIEHTQNRNMDESKKEIMKQRIEGLESKVGSTQENYLYWILQGERLQNILKICDDNKTGNEEWIRGLNQLLNTLNKMIKWEQDDIKKSRSETQELRKIVRQYQAAFNQKMQNHYGLIQTIKDNLKNKKKVDEIFVQSDSVIQNNALQQIERLEQEKLGHDTLRKIKDKNELQQKSSKQINEQVEYYRQKISNVLQHIDINDPNYQKSKNFQNFLAQLEKRQDLEAIILQRDFALKDLQAQIDQRKALLKTHQQAYGQQNIEEILQNIYNRDQKMVESLENEQNSEVLHEELNKKSYINERLDQTQLKCYMTVKSILKKFNLNQDSSLQATLVEDSEMIREKLEQKIQLIKDKLQDESFRKKFDFEDREFTFEDFLNGNYDKNILYRGVIPNQQDDLEDFESSDDNSKQQI